MPDTLLKTILVPVFFDGVPVFLMVFLGTNDYLRYEHLLIKYFSIWELNSRSVVVTGHQQTSQNWTYSRITHFQINASIF